MIKKIKAIYKGQNGILGYETDKEYELLIGVSQNKIIIERLKDGERTTEGFCEYGNLMIFLENWDYIRSN